MPVVVILGEVGEGVLVQDHLLVMFGDDSAVEATVDGVWDEVGLHGGVSFFFHELAALLGFDEG